MNHPDCGLERGFDREGFKLRHCPRGSWVEGRGCRLVALVLADYRSGSAGAAGASGTTRFSAVGRL